MPEPCDCGDPCCACCYPTSYRQARAWERDQAAMDCMTSAAHRPSASPRAVRTGADLRPPRIPDTCDLWDKRGDHARDMAGCGEGEK